VQDELIRHVFTNLVPEARALSIRFSPKALNYCIAEKCRDVQFHFASQQTAALFDQFVGAVEHRAATLHFASLTPANGS
jgi:hypothetical protein